MASGKSNPEFERFNALVGKVLSIPKTVLDKRIEEDEKRTKSNPKKRVPKSKSTT